MDALRKIALVARGFYLITFITSIPAVFLLDPVLNDSNYIVSSGADTRVLCGRFLEVRRPHAEAHLSVYRRRSAPEVGRLGLVQRTEAPRNG